MKASPNEMGHMDMKRHGIHCTDRKKEWILPTKKQKSCLRNNETSNPCTFPERRLRISYLKTDTRSKASRIPAPDRACIDADTLVPHPPWAAANPLQAASRGSWTVFYRRVTYGVARGWLPSSREQRWRMIMMVARKAFQARNSWEDRGDGT